MCSYTGTGATTNSLHLCCCGASICITNGTWRQRQRCGPRCRRVCARTVAVTHKHALPRRRMLASEQMLRPGCRLDGVASLDVEEQSWSRGVIGTAFACKRGGAVSLCAVTWKPSWLHSESSGVNTVQPSPSNATGASRNPGVCCATSNGARQESARCCTSARYAPESRARATCSWPLR